MCMNPRRLLSLGERSADALSWAHEDERHQQQPEFQCAAKSAYGQGLFAGGEGAPELNETLLNVGINSAALAVLGFFLLRDLRGQQSDRKIVEREESLARLQVRCSLAHCCTISGISQDSAVYS